MAQFYTLLTNAGINAIISARASNGEVNLSKFAVGDGEIVPSQSMTGLQSEKHRFNINSITQDPVNLNYLILEGVIPSNVGGFYISEIAIYTDTNILFAIGSLPKTYKPLLVEGSAKDLTIKVILEVANATNVTLKVDDSVVLATRTFVLNEFKKYAFVNGDETKKFKVADAIELSEAINKKQLNEAIGNIQTLPIGAILNGYTIFDNCIVAFGGEFNRADYPKLWAYLVANPSLVKTQAQWQTEATTNGGICGFFSSGDGINTFRVPNLDKAFLRADSRGIGNYQGDAIRDITGTIGSSWFGDHATLGELTGAFSSKEWGSKGDVPEFILGGTTPRVANFKASYVVPTSTENRPKNIAVLPLIVAK